MSDVNEPTIDDIEAELEREEREAQARMDKLKEQRRKVQERAAEKAEQERKAEEERQRKAEEDRKAEADRKAAEDEKERLAEEGRKRQAEEERKAKEDKERKDREDTAEADRRATAKVKFDDELREFKAREKAENERRAEEERKADAGNGLKFVTPGDLAVLDAAERARQMNADLAKRRAEGFKPRSEGSGSGKKANRNITREVRDAEKARGRGADAEQDGEVVVSSRISASSAFLTWYFF
jgi:hypothetical protein